MRVIEGRQWRETVIIARMIMGGGNRQRKWEVGR